MNKPLQNSAKWSDNLTARKLHLEGIIIVLAEIKNFNARASRGTKVETLTIDAVKAELGFIDLQLKRKG